MINKKYTKPIITRHDIYFEDSIAAGSGTLEPGDGNGIPDIIDETEQGKEEDWVFDN